MGVASRTATVSVAVGAPPARKKSKNSLDKPSNLWYNTHMNYHFDPEIHGDDRDDYIAHQEAELAEAMGETVELVDDDELRSLLAEIWQEEADRMAHLERQQEEYSEEDAFRDFYTDYANDMEG